MGHPDTGDLMADPTQEDVPNERPAKFYGVGQEDIEAVVGELPPTDEEGTKE